MKMKKDEHGVSPIVATILMVIITLVLAAVLYQPGCIDGASETPVGSLTVKVLGPTSVNITFGTFSPQFKPTDIKLRLTNNSDTDDWVDLSFTGAPDSGTVRLNATGSVTATYTDYNYLGNTINPGDYIVIEGLHEKTAYTVVIYHIPTQALCSLAGSTTFILG